MEDTEDVDVASSHGQADVSYTVRESQIMIETDATLQSGGNTQSLPASTMPSLGAPSTGVTGAANVAPVAQPVQQRRSRAPRRANRSRNQKGRKATKN